MDEFDCPVGLTTGIIGGNLNVGSGAIVAPGGAGIGTLTVNGLTGLTASGGSIPPNCGPPTNWQVAANAGETSRLVNSAARMLPLRKQEQGICCQYNWH